MREKDEERVTTAIMRLLLMLLFFFSSRRRHTRFDCDWSSDVCSSDLELWRAHYYIGRIYRDTGKSKEAAEALTRALQGAPSDPGPWVALAELYRRWEIGRASCRERV